MTNNKKIEKIIKLARDKNLTEFRKHLKSLLNSKIAKKLDEKERELSKKMFKDAKK
jgi:ribosomal protein L17